MSCLTRLYFHTGTTAPTDIGPASGGVLHSLTVDTSSVGGFTITLRDGGSSGTIIYKGALPNPQWKGVKLTGQLNIELSSASLGVSAELSEI